MTEAVNEYGHEHSPSEPGHLVQFYEDDAFLAEAVSRFIDDGLQGGEAGIVIATQPHLAAIGARLSARGLDLATARARGQYVAVDAAETLAKLMIDRRPGPSIPGWDRSRGIPTAASRSSGTWCRTR